MIQRYLKLSLILFGALLWFNVPPVFAAEYITCADDTVRQVTESDTAHDNVANLCKDNGGVKSGATVESKPPPSCYGTDGKTPKNCDFSSSTKLEDGKCYQEQKPHPSSISTGYTEIPCSGASAESSPKVDCKKTPGDTKNCISTPKSSAIIKCQGQESTACGLFGYINMAITLLSAAIGIVVTIMIIVGGIEYSAAGGDPGKVQKAKGLIFKGVFALIGYGLLFAIAKWLLPGGIL